MRRALQTPRSAPNLLKLYYNQSRVRRRNPSARRCSCCLHQADSNCCCQRYTYIYISSFLTTNHAMKFHQGAISNGGVNELTSCNFQPYKVNWVFCPKLLSCDVIRYSFVNTGGLSTI